VKVNFSVKPLPVLFSHFDRQHMERGGTIRNRFFLLKGFLAHRVHGKTCKREGRRRMRRDAKKGKEGEVYRLVFPECVNTQDQDSLRFNSIHPLGNRLLVSIAVFVYL
jgi:hypothetical protein